MGMLNVGSQMFVDLLLESEMVAVNSSGSMKRWTKSVSLLKEARNAKRLTIDCRSLRRKISLSLPRCSWTCGPSMCGRPSQELLWARLRTYRSSTLTVRLTSFPLGCINCYMFRLLRSRYCCAACARCAVRQSSASAQSRSYCGPHWRT
jgi:hypothetical protein